MPKDQLLHRELTDQILKAYFYVYKTLGYGFLEKVYENAMVVTLRGWGRSVGQQVPVRVFFEGEVVGNYFADLIVDGRVIVELKAAESLDPAHESQLLNYLKATNIEVGLLLNFGTKPDFRRKVYGNERKPMPSPPHLDLEPAIPSDEILMRWDTDESD